MASNPKKPTRTRQKKEKIPKSFEEALMDPGQDSDEAEMEIQAGITGALAKLEVPAPPVKKVPAKPAESKQAGSKTPTSKPATPKPVRVAPTEAQVAKADAKKAAETEVIRHLQEDVGRLIREVKLLQRKVKMTDINSIWVNPGDVISMLAKIEDRNDRFRAPVDISVTEVIIAQDVYAECMAMSFDAKLAVLYKVRSTEKTDSNKFI